jgi:uncharacterized membrane protein YkoI
MVSTRTRLGLAAIAASLFACTLPAVADDDDDDHDNATMEQRASAHGLISPEQAVEKALAAKAGKVTDVDLDHEWFGYVYEIELVDEAGVEWDIDIDAKSGEVRKVKRDD